MARHMEHNKDLGQVVANQDTGKSKGLVESHFPLLSNGNTPIFKQYRFQSEHGKRSPSIWLI